ncbi:hypothetical protein DY000_02008353 [Brassica cretica]|uniref:Uncharacterized protein n=1 Tax=Brassica cretica TaxID=69181 RepID=A0ABQ7CHN1_BRACR|nr:hypothetical protein DY000_02008353 [Brassica cretica]
MIVELIAANLSTKQQSLLYLSMKNLMKNKEHCSEKEPILYEEVQDLLQRVERMEVNELRVEVQNVKEEVLQCKIELKKSKMKCLVLPLCFCILVVVIVYHLMFEGESNK